MADTTAGSKNLSKDFEVGDVVRLKSGSKPMTITSIIKEPIIKDGVPTNRVVQVVCWDDKYEDMVKWTILPEKAIKLVELDQEQQDDGTSQTERTEGP